MDRRPAEPPQAHRMALESAQGDVDTGEPLSMQFSRGQKVDMKKLRQEVRREEDYFAPIFALPPTRFYPPVGCFPPSAMFAACLCAWPVVLGRAGQMESKIDHPRLLYVVVPLSVRRWPLCVESVLCLRTGRNGQN